MTKCPVCEMPVEEDDVFAQMDYNGRTYFFCSTGCKDEFESTPDKYLQNISLDMDDDYDHSA